MRLYNTVDDIKSEMEILYRNITGKPSFTAGDADIVYGSIIDAYQRVLREYGIVQFRFQIIEDTLDTVSGQNYVDLDEYVFKIQKGSVRIPAQDQVLGLIDEVTIFQGDPRDEVTGVPTSYAYKNSTDPNIIRVRLYPTPDAVYTIYLNQFIYPTDVMTNFPTDLVSAIKFKAKALSCLGLGIGNYQPGFDREYEIAINQVKDGYDDDGPKHVGRTFLSSDAGGSIESRISD